MFSISTHSLVLLYSLTVGVNSEISSWFSSAHQTGHHHDHDKNGTHRPLHEILNITKGEMKARDVSGAASSAESFATSAVPTPILPGGAFPPGAFPPIGGGYPGLFPGFGGGAGLNFGLDAGIGGGIFSGIYPYFPVIEKVIVIVGGGILILIFLALLQGFLVKGGFLGDFGDFGLGASAAKSFAGAVDVNAGPFHASKSASGSLSFDQNAGLTQRVMNGVNTRW